MPGRKFSLNQRVFRGNTLIGHGLNDTTIPEQRQDGEFKTLENWDYLFPGSLIKCKGRLLINDEQASRITGFIVPPTELPLLEITTANHHLYFKYNTTYYTAAVAVGKYYEHADLATALHTALEGANIALANKFTVVFSAGKYTITCSDQDIVLLWLNTSTTLPKETFGFSGPAPFPTAGLVATSEFVCPLPPPYNRFVTTADGKLYKLSTDFTTITEILYPDASAFEASSIPWMGQFQGDLWHGSNSKESLMMRDNTQIKKMLANGLAYIVGAQKTDIEAKTYLYDTAFDDSVTLIPKSLPGGSDKMQPTFARLFFTADASPSYLIDTLKLKLRAHNSDGGVTNAFKVEFYHEIPEIGYCKLIDTVLSSDLDATAGGTNYTSDARWVYPSNSGLGNQYILVKLVPIFKDVSGNPTLTIFGNNVASGGNVWIDDGYGHLVAPTTGEEGKPDFKWWGEISMAKVPDGAAQTRKFRVSLVNKEGFETQLESENVKTTAAFLNDVWDVSFAIVASQRDLYDIEAVRLYCTDDAGSVFYRRAEVPINWFTGNFLLYTNMTDLIGAGSIEADVLTLRDAPPPFKYSVVWQGRVWMVSDEYPNRLLWCDVAGDGQMIPESIDLAHSQMPIGKDRSPITGLCGFEDRLMVFKAMNPSLIVPSGNSWQQTEIKGMGTLSHYSIRSFRSDDGAGFVWQGTDGHFYYSDGMVITNLSQGKLETMVGGT